MTAQMFVLHLLPLPFDLLSPPGLEIDSAPAMALAQLALFQLFQLGFGQISAPSSCSISQASFVASNPSVESVSVTSTDQRLSFSLQVTFEATCSSSTGETTWVSASGARSYYVQGIDSYSSKTGETFYGVQVKDTQSNNDFKYGLRWPNQPCVSEQFHGTWTAGSTICDSTGGSVSGTDCINLFNAVDASVCWQITNPMVCIDNKLVSGALQAYGSLSLVAAGTSVSSSPSTVLDLSSYYTCSGESKQVESSLAVSSVTAATAKGFLLTLVYVIFTH